MGIRSCSSTDRKNRLQTLSTIKQSVENSILVDDVVQTKGVSFKDNDNVNLIRSRFINDEAEEKRRCNSVIKIRL